MYEEHDVVAEVDGDDKLSTGKNAEERKRNEVAKGDFYG